MTDSSARVRELERALQNLQIYAVPFATGRGMQKARGNLMTSIKEATDVLNFRPCERDREASLRELADAADEAAQQEHGHRKDLNG